MWHGLRRSVVVGVLVIAGMAALVPSALASITPTMSLDQSNGTAAGGTANLGVDLKFAPSGSDSPQDMTLTLPPGLLANASIDGGACLSTADLTDANCQVGTGTVTADAYGYIPITTPVTFDLVPPPAAGDLAGLAVNSSGTQIGATADVKVRPSGDPNGVGITITFVLPNSLDGVPISIAEIGSTFDGLRYPATCPSTPQNFAVSVNSYSDTTVHTVSAPLSVTGCASLPYSPAFAVTAARDSADKQVKVSTDITQGVTEAPNRAVSLILPTLLAPNLGSVKSLCPNLSAGTCVPVGSATASSPLYPTPLTGQAYLTGSLAGLSLTLVFPSPFPLTLTGTVNLGTNTTAFTGLPDIPLTDLQVTLNGGATGLFQASCATSSGTASAALTDQNGDKSATVPAKFTVSGCPGSGSSSGSGASGGGRTSGSPTVSAPTASGLRSGRVGLSFKVTVRRGASKIRAVSVALPAGLRFVAHHGGVTVAGATVKSLAVSHGRLVITLRRAVASVRVKVGPAALKESASLISRIKAHKVKRVALTVLVTNAKAKRTTIHVRIAV